jgi:crossover junction endodeoxyribonuclease RuvC
LDDGHLTDVVDMPVLSVRRGKSDKREVDGHALAALLRGWGADVGVIEQVGGIQGQAAGAAFNFGRAAGAVEYTMVTLGMRLVRVAPITWKKRLGIRGGKDDSRAAALRLWPGMAERFKRVKDDGRAEAGLIGHWYNLTNGARNDVFA